MSIPGRTFDRTLVAKLSDVRERLHVLLARAEAERVLDAAPPVVWPRDINDAAGEAEVSRG
jgi:hypothetical protein